MYQVTVRDGDSAWASLDFPGVRMKVLHRNAATGALAVLTQMAAGAAIPAHWHTTADETVYVLEGDFVEDGTSYGPGAYFVGRARTGHGPHATVRGCTLLTHFSGELDFRTDTPPES